MITCKYKSAVSKSGVEERFGLPGEATEAVSRMVYVAAAEMLTESKRCCKSLTCLF
jgi:hypothetical protein